MNTTVPFTKAEMQAELQAFLEQYALQIAWLLGTSDSESRQEDYVRASRIWRAIDAMYDYGVLGIPAGTLVPGGYVDSLHSQAEKFLHAVSTPAMMSFLDEHGSAPPKLALRAARTASARMALDGIRGRLMLGFDEAGRQGGVFDGLSLAEVAMLANMDERSVRNAANPRLATHLKTAQRGNRTFVEPEEALRWLSDRKGFKPTKPTDLEPYTPPNWDLPMTEEVVEKIQAEARALNIPLEIHMRNKIMRALELAKEQGVIK